MSDGGAAAAAEIIDLADDSADEDPPDVAASDCDVGDSDDVPSWLYAPFPLAQRAGRSLCARSRSRWGSEAKISVL